MTRNRIWLVIVVVGFAVSVAAAGPLGNGPSEKRGGSVARCTCPCQIACGNGVTCSCTGGGHCTCGSVQLAVVDVVQLTSLERLVIVGSFAPWFESAPLVEVTVRLKASMADTFRQETWDLTFVPASAEKPEYVIAPGFDFSSFQTWRARIDKKQPAELTFAAIGDDPATYRIRDGNPQHLNESLEKRFSIVGLSGDIRPTFATDPTLSWEMQNALRTSVTCMDDAAFRGDVGKTKEELYAAFDTIGGFLKALDLRGANGTIDDLSALIGERLLDPEHPHTQRLLGALGNLHRLLDSLTAGRPGPLPGTN